MIPLSSQFKPKPRKSEMSLESMPAVDRLSLVVRVCLKQRNQQISNAALILACPDATEDMTRLQRTVMELSEAKAAVGMLTAIQSRLKVAESHEMALKMVSSLVTATLLRGADDSWSGRSNEFRRAEFDAIREVCGKVLEAME